MIDENQLLVLSVSGLPHFRFPLSAGYSVGWRMAAKKRMVAKPKAIKAELQRRKHLLPSLDQVDSAPTHFTLALPLFILVRAVCVNALVRICAVGDQRWSSLPRTQSTCPLMRPGK